MRLRLAIVGLLFVLPATAGARFNNFTAGRSLDEQRSRGSTAAADGSLFRFEPNVAAAAQCTGAAVTGSRAETITLSRSTTAYCQKEDGTLVLVTSGQPRMEASGLKVEPAHTNQVIRSQEFDNVAWTVSNVTVTANSTTSPAGTATAETLESTVAGGYIDSTLFTTVGTTGYTSVYVKTASGTQTMDLVFWDHALGALLSTTTLVATTTWQRVSLQYTGATTSNNHSLRIYPGGAGTGTIIAWGADSGAGELAQTAYQPTTTAAATRNVERYFATVNWDVSNTPYATGTFTYSVSGATTTIFTHNTGAGSRNFMAQVTAGDRITCTYHDGTNSNTGLSGASSLTPGAENTFSCGYDGVNIRACANGACVDTADTFAMTGVAFTVLNIGGNTGSAQVRGNVRKFCFDVDSAGCP